MKKTQPGEAENCKVGREQADALASDKHIAWFGVMNRLWTTPKELTNYETKMKPAFPVAVDASGAAFRTFGVKRFPALAIVDTHGRLARLIDGEPDKFATAISSLK